MCAFMKVLIHGDAYGADKISGKIVESYPPDPDTDEAEVQVLKFPANWTKLGRAAGPVRNRQMLREGKPDFVLAFHKNLNESRGTKDMVAVARKAGIPVKIVEQ